MKKKRKKSETMLSMSWLLLLVLGLCHADFSDQCPRECTCKWANGKREADCTNAGFNGVPIYLHKDIQVRFKAKIKGKISIYHMVDHSYWRYYVKIEIWSQIKLRHFIQYFLILVIRLFKVNLSYAKSRNYEYKWGKPIKLLVFKNLIYCNLILLDKQTDIP